MRIIPLMVLSGFVLASAACGAAVRIEDSGTPDAIAPVDGAPSNDNGVSGDRVVPPDGSLVCSPGYQPGCTAEDGGGCSDPCMPRCTGYIAIDTRDSTRVARGTFCADSLATGDCSIGLVHTGTWRNMDSVCLSGLPTSSHGATGTLVSRAQCQAIAGRLRAEHPELSLDLGCFYPDATPDRGGALPAAQCATAPLRTCGVNCPCDWGTQHHTCAFYSEAYPTGVCIASGSSPPASAPSVPCGGYDGAPPCGAGESCLRPVRHDNTIADSLREGVCVSAATCAAFVAQFGDGYRCGP